VSARTAAVLIASTIACKGSGDTEYRVVRTSSPSSSLLAADDASWRTSQRVVWGPDSYATAFRAAWNDEGLYLRFDATDRDPWHTRARHDDKLWDEEVVEIFLQPVGRDEYGELEISPANVTCDVRVVPSAHHFDLSWNIEGLETRVTSRASGWTATAFVPWRGFTIASGAPHAGDRWRFNLFRIERPGGAARPEDGALYLAWSPTGKSTFHVPAAFRAIVFSAD
jgi:hypothetical protein